ncbi:hypothetical protein QBC43DRAFT_286801 [Cladorrhinum sp. PSN259]|nr:hypothetical protein QBC43DRAFT_286801 [Cladorrhinum sp. PSN259]
MSPTTRGQQKEENNDNVESEVAVVTKVPATNCKTVAVVEKAPGAIELEGEDARIQPWQAIMEEIERQNSLSPPGSDYFPCQHGFYAHSLAG